MVVDQRSFIRYVQSTAWRERDSRLLFIFIAMKFGIMLLQFTYGVATGATGSCLSLYVHYISYALANDGINEGWNCQQCYNMINRCDIIIISYGL
jgi:MFS superfamily sulfate permease-like transporter